MERKGINGASQQNGDIALLIDNQKCGDHRALAS